MFFKKQESGMNDRVCTSESYTGSFSEGTPALTGTVDTKEQARERIGESTNEQQDKWSCTWGAV